MVTSERSMPTSATIENADQHGEQRQESPAHLEDQGEHDRHDDQRCDAEGDHAALQVVVDLLQVDRRTGDGEVEALEFEVVEDGEDLVGGRRLLVEVGVAGEHDATDCDRVGGAALDVREGRAQRTPDLELLTGGWLGTFEALVAEDQEVVVGRVADDALGGRHRRESSDRGADVALPGLDRFGVTSRGGEQRRGTDTTAEQVVGELQRHVRRDDGVHVVDATEFVGDGLEPGEVGVVEQVGDVVALVGGEQQDDRLAAEVVLEVDIVDRDLGLGVEVAVLPGGEVDLGQADGAEHHGDHEQRGADQLPLLAELPSELTPEPIHHALPPTNTAGRV